MFAPLLDLDHPLLWTVDDVLSPAECAAEIARIEAHQPSLATVNTGRAPEGELRPELRNNDRVIFDDPELARTLFDRVRPHLPAAMKGWTLCGVNERFRCYRYRPGHYFRLHTDGAFFRDELERSFLTFMIYLNTVDEGGGTEFPELQRLIEPQPGRALFFQHPLLHEGQEVRAGVKYAIRSDIMYRAP